MCNSVMPCDIYLILRQFPLRISDKSSTCLWQYIVQSFCLVISRTIAPCLYRLLVWILSQFKLWRFSQCAFSGSKHPQIRIDPWLLATNGQDRCSVFTCKYPVIDIRAVKKPSQVSFSMSYLCMSCNLVCMSLYVCHCCLYLVICLSAGAVMQSVCLLVWLMTYI